MSRPEVNTGSLFSAIAASRNNVNKSDAVIVITAAILETIGSKRAAERLLNKSGTVSSFYEKMNLTDDLMRDSFVVLLFALSPEFVKMIESAVKLSIERVQEVTDAPHAGTKMLEAAGELARTESISVAEHSQIMKDFANGRDIPRLSSTFVPASVNENDHVQISDSVSNLGLSPRANGNTNIREVDLMSYIKESNASNRSAFSGVFPGAKAPIQVIPRQNRTGLGFTLTSEIGMEDDQESGISGIMNNLLPKRTLVRRPKIMHGAITKAGFTTTNDIQNMIADSTNSSITNSENIVWADALVTREDITEEVGKTRADIAGRSFAATAMTEDEEAKYLLSLL
jgi:hypothetical protein